MAGTNTKAVDSEQVVSSGGKNYLRRIEAQWVGDASDGSVPDLVISAVWGFLDRVEIVPGASVAPTDGYNAYVKDQALVDILGGVGSGSSSTATGTINMVPRYQLDGDDLTVSISGNSVVSATGKVVLHLSRSKG